MSRRQRIKEKLKSLTERDILKAMRDTVDSGYEMFTMQLNVLLVMCGDMLITKNI